ncbi:hypothetical protein BV25DRAFT_1830500, partial [Artomyces pyxidatus]
MLGAWLATCIGVTASGVIWVQVHQVKIPCDYELIIDVLSGAQILAPQLTEYSIHVSSAVTLDPKPDSLAPGCASLTMDARAVRKVMRI